MKEQWQNAFLVYSELYDGFIPFWNLIIGSSYLSLWKMPDVLGLLSIFTVHSFSGLTPHEFSSRCQILPQQLGYDRVGELIACTPGSIPLTKKKTIIKNRSHYTISYTAHIM
jgi:hypothetical protein